MTVATFFAFVSIGVVLPSCRAAPRVPSAPEAWLSGLRSARPACPPGSSSGRDWGGSTVEEAALTRASGQLRRWGSFPGTREVLAYPFRAREAGRVDDLDDARPALADLSWELPDGLEPATPPYQELFDVAA